MSSHVLFITEGQKTEINILNILKDQFLQCTNVIYVSYCTHIYTFYKKIMDADGNFLDTVEMLKDCNHDFKQSQLSRDDFSEIYLFFDYDGHVREANDSTIIDMLNYFNNETENGKLYISYPMVEAIKHFLPTDSLPHLHDISLGKNYKNIVSTPWKNKYQNGYEIEKKLWITQFLAHLCAAQHIVSNTDTLPTYREILENLTQINIFKNQSSKYISPITHVAVFSPFCLFIIEYLGERELIAWQNY